MKLKDVFVWTVLIILAFNMTACMGVDTPLTDSAPRVAPVILDGILLEINTGTVARGIGSIAGNVAFNAKVYTDPKGQQFVITWLMPRLGQAWVAFDGKSLTPISDFLINCQGKGNICSLKTWKSLEGLMKDSGWTELSPEARIQLAKIVYIVLVGLSSKEFVMPVMLVPSIDPNGDVDWADYFEDVIKEQMCAPLYMPDGTQFDPCEVGPQT